MNITASGTVNHLFSQTHLYTKSLYIYDPARAQNAGEGRSCHGQTAEVISQVVRPPKFHLYINIITAYGRISGSPPPTTARNLTFSCAKASHKPRENVSQTRAWIRRHVIRRRREDLDTQVPRRHTKKTGDTLSGEELIGGIRFCRERG